MPLGIPRGGGTIGGHFIGAHHGWSEEVAGAAGVGNCAVVVLGGVGGN